MAGNKNFFWCIKYVRILYTDIPIWRKTKRTLLIDAPASSTAKLRRTFPAGYLLNSGGYGWLLQVKGFPSQWEQYWRTVTMVPVCFITTLGLAVLHRKQNIRNRLWSMLKNTTNFGLFSIGVSFSTLWEKNKKTKQNRDERVIDPCNFYLAIQFSSFYYDVRQSHTDRQVLYY